MSKNHTEGTLVCAVFRVLLAWCVRCSAGTSCASCPILSPSIWEVAQLAKVGVFTPQEWASAVTQGVSSPEEPVDKRPPARTGHVI